MTGLSLQMGIAKPPLPGKLTALGRHSRPHHTALAATLAEAPTSQVTTLLLLQTRLLLATGPPCLLSELTRLAQVQAALVPQQSTSILQADVGPAPRAQHAIVAKARLPPQLEAVPAPEAATILFPTRFPTITSARKACRRKWLMVQEKLATACT